MSDSIFTCTRCLFSSPREAGMRFCPRCGLAEELNGDEQKPMVVQVRGESVVVQDRLGFGEISNLYRCTIKSTGRAGVFKIARTHLANQHISRGHDVLCRLDAADPENRFTAFFPTSLATVSYEKAGEPARLAALLSYHQDISGPDDLYSLEEVRAAYPEGIDARDMAWMWRRVLTVLGFVHGQRTVHGAVTPDHLLIEPKEHKLILAGWCGAVAFGNAPVLLPARWKGWSNWDGGATEKTDLASAAKSMTYLLTSNSEPAIIRHLERAGDSSSGAWKLLEDFDRMIEALWGPRQFRAFAMPLRKE